MQRILLASLGLLAAAVCAASDLDSRPAELRRLVKALDIQPQASTSRGSPALCRSLLAHLTSDDRVPMRPQLVLESFDEAKLAPYVKSCARPSLDVREYKAPPAGLTYWATSTFRVYEIPEKRTNRESKGRFMLFAQSYASSLATEPPRKEIRRFPGSELAWPDGGGGGAIYSIVNRANCSFEDQLVVHGEFNHVKSRPTPHFSEPFIFGKTLYVYDFHNYADPEHDYAGIVVWSLDNPGRPRQTCSYNSADARAQLGQ